MTPAFDDSDYLRLKSFGVSLGDPVLAERATVERLVAEYEAAEREHWNQLCKSVAPPVGKLHPPGLPALRLSKVTGLSWQEYAETCERCADYHSKRADGLWWALAVSMVVNGVFGLLLVAGWFWWVVG